MISPIFATIGMYIKNEVDMESIIFLTTLSACLTTPYAASKGRTTRSRMKQHGNNLERMDQSQTWFTIKLADTVYPVYRVVQSDESVLFIIEMEGRKIKLFRGENDNWDGDAEPELIDKIGRAIEEA
jgi:hypothetical protein